MTERGMSQWLGESAAFWVALTFLASSIEPIAVKIGYAQAADPIHLLLIKAITGAVFMVPMTGRWNQLSMPIIRRYLPAGLYFAITTVFVFMALKFLPAVMVITVSTSTPALVTLINQARGREQVGGIFWTGFLLCVVGNALTLEFGATGASAYNLPGVLCALASVFFSALYRTSMDDLTREFTPRTSSLIIYLLNAGIMALACLPWLPTIPAGLIPLGTLIGFAGAVANIAFLTALHLLGSTRISIVSILQRPLVILAVALILKEPLGWSQVLGMIMVLTGIRLAGVKRGK